MSNGIKKQGIFAKWSSKRAKKTRQTHGKWSLRSPSCPWKKGPCRSPPSTLRLVPNHAWKKMALHFPSLHSDVLQSMDMDFILSWLFSFDLQEKLWGKEQTQTSPSQDTMCRYVEVQNFRQSTHEVPMEWLQPTGSRTCRYTYSWIVSASLIIQNVWGPNPLHVPNTGRTSVALLAVSNVGSHEQRKNGVSLSKSAHFGGPFGKKCLQELEKVF